MKQIDRRGALGGIGLLLTTAAGFAATPSRHLADELPPLDLEANIPRQFGDWTVDKAMLPVMPAADVQEQLDKLYNKLLSRTYVDQNRRRVMFVIAYGADQADRMTLAHLPEACYSTQGFEVFPTSIATIAIGTRAFNIVRLRTRKSLRNEPVTYWTTVGDRTLTDEVSRRWVRARYSLRGLIPDGMMVRISSIEPNDDQAFALHANFVTQLYARLSPPTRARLFGTTS